MTSQRHMQRLHNVDRVNPMPNLGRIRKHRRKCRPVAAPRLAADRVSIVPGSLELKQPPFGLRGRRDKSAADDAPSACVLSSSYTPDCCGPCAQCATALSALRVHGPDRFRKNPSTLPHTRSEDPAHRGCGSTSAPFLPTATLAPYSTPESVTSGGIPCGSPLRPAANSYPSRRLLHISSGPSLSTVFSRACPFLIGATPAPFRVTFLSDVLATDSPPFNRGQANMTLRTCFETG